MVAQTTESGWNVWSWTWLENVLQYQHHFLGMVAWLFYFFLNRPLIHSRMTQRHPGSQTKFSDTVGSFHRKNRVVNFLSAFVYFLTLWIISLFFTFARHFFLFTKIRIISQLFVKHSRLCLLMGFFKWNCGWSTKEVYLGQEQLYLVLLLLSFCGIYYVQESWILDKYFLN